MKTKNIKLLFSFFFCILLNISNAQQAESNDLETMIKTVEMNLLPPVRIAGESPWTLSERMDKYNVQAVSIAVIDGFELQWAKAYGIADAKTKRPATTATLFQAASISKSLNALGIVKLKESGSVNLEKDINDYLKSWQFPYDAKYGDKKINLTHLLSHTAGLSTSGFDGYRKRKRIPTLLEILDGKKKANTQAVRQLEAPGLGFRYSGGGTLISQLIIEDITGLSYADYMQQEVLQALNMKTSNYAHKQENETLRASAHWRNGDRLKSKYHVYPELAAAGLWTNPTELAYFVIAMQKALQGEENQVISPASSQWLTTPIMEGFLMTPGFFIKERNGTRYFHNAGSNEGFTCHFFGSMENGQGVVIMTNSESYEIIGEIANSVAVIYNWKDFYNNTKRKISKVNPQDLQILTGNYQFDTGSIWEISYNDHKLMLDKPDEGTIDLLPETNRFFFQENEDVQVEFVSNGRSFDLLLHRNGKIYRAIKKG